MQMTALLLGVSTLKQQQRIHWTSSSNLSKTKHVYVIEYQRLVLGPRTYSLLRPHHLHHHLYADDGSPSSSLAQISANVRHTCKDLFLHVPLTCRTSASLLTQRWFQEPRHRTSRSPGQKPRLSRSLLLPTLLFPDQAPGLQMLLTFSLGGTRRLSTPLLRFRLWQPPSLRSLRQLLPVVLLQEGGPNTPTLPWAPPAFVTMCRLLGAASRPLSDPALANSAGPHFTMPIPHPSRREHPTELPRNPYTKRSTCDL